MITREEAAEYVRLFDGVPRQTQGVAYARSVVRLHDEVARLSTDLQLTRNSEVACLAELKEKDAQVSDLTTRLRLAEASVSLLRADLDSTRAELETFAAFHRAKTDALALELRRLRAADAPGTDDAAFEGTGWKSRPGYWTHDHPTKEGIKTLVGRARNGRAGWIVCGSPGAGWGAIAYSLALDAMRAAVPGSV